MKRLGNRRWLLAWCAGLSLSFAAPAASVAETPGQELRAGIVSLEVCEVTPSFYRDKDGFYRLHFASKCSKSVFVSGKYNGAPFGVRVAANSTGEVTLGKSTPDPAKLTWDFEIED